MIKPLLAFFIILLLFTDAEAQKGGIVYYLTNSGKLVSTKDSADYSMVVSPPDSSIDKTMYVVREYDKNGKVRLVTGSKTNDVNLQYWGRYVAYYTAGKKKSTGTFKDGKLSGSRVEYYPTGKFYNSINCLPGDRVLYNTCMDSLGKTLAENGTGEWIDFDESFTKIIAQGKIVNGVRDGEWREKKNDTVTKINNYNNGMLMSSDEVDASGKTIFRPVEVVPSFPGGLEAFYQFINKNTKYPRTAYENNTSGKVIISFVVERDGSLTDVKVKRGIGDGCDEEAMRVIKLSSPWIPGTQGGKPVRVAYSVPISFGLSN
ncbi:energy transducer TonB [Mucilaginibacter sp.]|uniref:energy transducer TonB n=1 Tax=Mucilaginibacter sp. TaxID=1882438 RepID=UPI0025E3DF9C|nr:energy transducer TonB [Mucilaginibacter sp.]